MNHRTIILCLSSFFTLLHSGQSQSKVDPQWLFKISPYSHVQGDHIDMDYTSDGSMVTCYNVSGKFSHPELNNGESIEGNRTYLPVIMKNNPNGEIEWAYGIRAYSGIVSSVAISPEDEIIICGSILGEAIFPSLADSTVISCDLPYEKWGDQKNLFLAKYSSEGELLWLNTYEDYGGVKSEVVCNSHGKIYWSIEYYGDLKQEDSYLIQGREEDYLMKKNAILTYHSNGDFDQIIYHWTHSHPNKIHLVEKPVSVSCHIEMDSEDHLIIWGGYCGILNLKKEENPQSEIPWFEDKGGYIAKLNPNDELIWQYKISAKISPYIRDLALDKENNLYFTGEFSGDVIISKDINPLEQKENGFHRAGESFMYFKISQDGNFEFIRCHKQDKDYTFCSGQTLDIDENGYTHLSGYYNDSLNFNSKTPTLFNGTHVTPFKVDGIDSTFYHKKYKTGVFYSIWDGDSLIHLEEIIQNSNISNNRIYQLRKLRIQGDQMNFTGVYFGAPQLSTIDKKFDMSRDSDRQYSYYVCGSKLPNLPPRTDMDILASNEEKTIHKLKQIEETEESEDELGSAVQKPSKPIEIIDSHDDQSHSHPSEEFSLWAYPNPTREEVNIKTSGFEGDVSIRIYSSLGQLIYAQETNEALLNETYRFDLSSLSPGTYWVEFRNAVMRKTVGVVLE